MASLKLSLLFVTMFAAACYAVGSTPTSAAGEPTPVTDAAATKPGGGDQKADSSFLEDSYLLPPYPLLYGYPSPLNRRLGFPVGVPVWNEFDRYSGFWPYRFREW